MMAMINNLFARIKRKLDEILCSHYWLSTSLRAILMISDDTRANSVCVNCGKRAIVKVGKIRAQKAHHNVSRETKGGK